MLLGILVIVVLYVGGVLLYGTIYDFQPEDVTKLEPEQPAAYKMVDDTSLTFLIWNLGYGGLGAEANFFFDSQGMMRSNGKMIRPSKELVEKYVNGAVGFVKGTAYDFYLFQEIDYNSKRSYYINQFDEMKKVLPDYSATYAVNYLSDWVPIPLMEPWHAYGRVNAGLGTFSKYQPVTSVRYQLPGDYPWPMRIFQLDRCALVQHYPTRFGRDLVVVNIHNSAYDKGGELKAQQMAFLRDLLEKEYEQGNFVVVGGDWNQCPPDFKFDALMPGKSGRYSQTNVAQDFMGDTDWTWAANTTIATNRKVGDSYNPGTTFETIIDFYLISPNVKLEEIKGVDLGFKYSDHQPVVMRVLLTEK